MEIALGIFFEHFFKWKKHLEFSLIVFPNSNRTWNYSKDFS